MSAGWKTGPDLSDRSSVLFTQPQIMPDKAKGDIAGAVVEARIAVQSAIEADLDPGIAQIDSVRRTSPAGAHKLRDGLGRAAAQDSWQRRKGRSVNLGQLPRSLRIRCANI
jgi:hypothetical protein